MYDQSGAPANEAQTLHRIRNDRVFSSLDLPYVEEVGNGVASGPLQSFQEVRRPDGQPGRRIVYQPFRILVWELDPRSPEWREHDTINPGTGFAIPHGVTRGNVTIDPYDLMQKLDLGVPARQKCIGKRLVPLIWPMLDFDSLVERVSRLGFMPRTLVWQVMGQPSVWVRITDEWTMSTWFDTQYKGADTVFELISISWVEENTPPPDAAHPLGAHQQYITLPAAAPDVSDQPTSLLASTARSVPAANTTAITTGNGMNVYAPVVGLP